LLIAGGDDVYMDIRVGWDKLRLVQPERVPDGRFIPRGKVAEQEVTIRHTLETPRLGCHDGADMQKR
jgi:hypothetical protein